MLQEQELFLFWESDHVPKASIEECSSPGSFFMVPLDRFVVIPLSVQMTVLKQDETGLVSFLPPLSACSQTLHPARKSPTFYGEIGRTPPCWRGLKYRLQARDFRK